VQELRTRIPRWRVLPQRVAGEDAYDRTEQHMKALGKQRDEDQDVRSSGGRSKHVSGCPKGVLISIIIGFE
jgi:hypothetical protein